MIKAIIQTGGDETYELEFPCHWKETNQWLTISNHNERVGGIRVNDERLHLESDSEIGNHLIKLLKKSDNLEEVNDFVTAVVNANEQIHDELEQAIIYDQYSSAEELYEDIHQMTKGLATLEETFYFPLVGSIYDNEYDEIFTVDNYQIVQYQSEIQQALDAYVDHDDMSEYYNGSGKEKLLLANWGLEEIEGKLYGKVDISFTNPMTEVETESLRKWIIGQNSDGLGEGFEQQDIQIDEGNLNVSFWHSGKDYFLYNQEEMDSYLQQKNDVILGGI